MTSRKTFRVAIRKFAPFESAIQKQWDAFEAEAHTGLALDAAPLDLEPLYDTLFERKGLLDGSWDLAFLNTDWLAQTHASEAVADLAPFLQDLPPEGFPEAWSDSLLRAQTIDGQVLGLPYHDGPECLIYRKDLFENPAEKLAYEERFGVPLDVPKTWADFHQIARFFQRPESNLYGTAFAAYPDGHNTVYDFLLQLWTRGGELFDASGKIQFVTPAADRALSFYREILRDTSAVHPRCGELDSVKTGLAFVDGKVAMMVNWFGFAAMAETVDNSRVRGCVDIAPVPSEAGHASTSMNVYWVLAVAAGSPHRDVAYRFARHAVSAGMDKLLTLEGGVGCRKSTWHDADVNRAIPFFKRLENIHSTARELPRMVEWPQIASVIDELMLNTINADLPIDRLLQQAQAKADSLFQSKILAV